MGEEGLVHLRGDRHEATVVTLSVERLNRKDVFLGVVRHFLDTSYPIFRLWELETGLAVEAVTQTVDCNTLVLRFAEPVVKGRFVCTVLG